MLAFKSTYSKHKSVTIGLLAALTTLPFTGNTQNQSGNSFTPDLFNIENTTNETFRYNAKLKNNESDPIRYELHAEVPAGWRSTFKTHGNGITSILIDPNKTENLTIELKPAYNCLPNTYLIPVAAYSDKDTLQFNLEAVVQGSYELSLSTPSGRLSGQVIEGEKMTVTLQVKNTGSLPLKDLELTSRNPSKWEVSFEPKTIDLIEPGKSADVSATLSIPDKTLPGDYISKITAKNTESSSSIDYRVTVKTSALAGWVGIFIILAALGIVFFLIRKFGRR